MVGRCGHGKMTTGYFWPIYGELDEVCFPFFPSRGSEHVRSALGLAPIPGRVLLTDGYAAYEKYARSFRSPTPNAGYIADGLSSRLCRPTPRRSRRL